MPRKKPTCSKILPRFQDGDCLKIYYGLIYLHVFFSYFFYFPSVLLSPRYYETHSVSLQGLLYVYIAVNKCHHRVPQCHAPSLGIKWAGPGFCNLENLSNIFFVPLSAPPPFPQQIPEIPCGISTLSIAVGNLYFQHW